MNRISIKPAALRGWAQPRAQAARTGFAGLCRRLATGRRAWLFAAELAGAALVTTGISLWSLPAALITGGLAVAAAVEVQPPGAPRLPAIPPPEEVLRAQAESAAMVLNTARFGLGSVDPGAIAKLTPAECERVITAARGLGARN